jgi:hypothetical protein
MTQAQMQVQNLDQMTAAAHLTVKIFALTI